MTDELERKYYLDVLKIVLAVLVIAIHTIPLNDFSKFGNDLLSNGIARLAVPCFFVINGYFSFAWYKGKRFWYIFINTCGVYCFWMLVFLPFYWEGNIDIRFLLYVFFGWHHLWYLAALLEVQLIFLLIYRYIQPAGKKLFILFLLLFFIGVFLQYGIEDIHTRYYRNGLFFGLPFFGFGLLMHEYQEKLRIWFSGRIVWVWFTISAFLFVIEVFVLHSLINVSSPDLLFSTLFIGPLLTFLIINLKKVYLAGLNLGKLAVLIFFIHPLFAHAVNSLLNYLDCKNSFTIFLTTVIFAVLCSYFILSVFMYMKKRYLSRAYDKLFKKKLPVSF